MRTWIAVLAVGALSYALRAVPLFSRRFAAPNPRRAQFFADAGTASLTAIVVLSLRHDVARFDRHALIVASAFAVGIWVAQRGRSLPIVVSSGMAAYVSLAVVLNHA